MGLMKRLFDNVDAVLFDLDGTLVETNIDFPLMKREMLRIAALAGVPEEELLSYDILGIVQCVEEMLGEDSGGEFRIQAYRILEEIELRHSRDTKEIAYAGELLAALKSRGVKIGIVTRNCRAASEMSIQIAGLLPDVMLAREDVAKAKPHPEHLLIALSRLDASPECSVMVGDHIMDIRAGKDAGLRTIGILATSSDPGFFDELAPDAVVESLKEILDAVIDSDS